MKQIQKVQGAPVKIEDPPADANLDSGQQVKTETQKSVLLDEKCFGNAQSNI